MARSNVCPELDPPAEPSFYVFSFTRPSTTAGPSFVISGSGEAREGGASYAERTVRYRDVSPDGMKDKVRLRGRRDGEPHGRFRPSAGRTPPRSQVYTIRDYHHVVAGRIGETAAPRVAD